MLRSDGSGSPSGRMDKTELAVSLEASLRTSILPYWYGMIDASRGGYRFLDEPRTFRSRVRVVGSLAKALLQNRLRGRPVQHREKHLVNQSRLLWTFSLAHRLGYGDAEHDYLRAAEWGYRFLIDRMLDRRNGGFHWRADLAGRIIDPRKVLYGQAFALYALIEFHRASGSPEPLDLARSHFDVIQARMHDERNSGWVEHCDADFKSLAACPDRSVQGLPDRVGLKSANAHLHWLEALSEHLDATGEAAVRSALEEVLDITNRFFFPADPASCCRYRTPDWGSIGGPGRDGFSFGHNVEYAWLMIRAQEILRTPSAWDRFDALLRHALKHGFDRERGGFYASGSGEGTATDTKKIWWVQAEGLAALSNALGHQFDREYDEGLDLLLHWILNHQTLPDGIWVWCTDATGTVTRFINTWKAAYHEVRALTKFIRTFGVSRD
jgi:mannose/cellobiose epimerase-like protein (N-acyl-D-glucosamine 2-epimerase family)